MLQDTTGRGIGYLRLSLTKACSMRCTYCRPEKLEHPKGEPVLTPAEVEQLTRYLVDRYGVYKVRLTGGDPTSRRELVEIIERVARIDGVRDVSMTTNGLTLVKQARDYVKAGLNRVNVSLDSLDAERFARMTGVDGLERVLDGLDAARDAGLSPVKLNTVVLRGENDAELPELVRFSAERDMPIRFIELMPMGPLASTWSQRYVTETEMREQIAPIVRTWAPLPQGPDAARRFDVVLDNGAVARIGFITPMSCNFCADCNRLRIAADGAVFPCLMDRPRGTLLDALRPVFDGPAVDRVLENAYAAKQPEHPHDGFVVMTHIGGQRMAQYTVKLFGPQAQLAQQREVVVELGGDATEASEILAAVGAACPAIVETLPSSRLAVNHAFVETGAAVRPSDEVALIGMLGGG